MRERQNPLAVLGDAAPVFAGLWGWAAIAVGLATLGPVVGVAVIGGVAALLSRTAPWITGIIEAVCFSAAFTVAPLPSQDFVLLGGALAGAGRVIRAIREIREIVALRKRMRGR